MAERKHFFLWGVCLSTTDSFKRWENKEKLFIWKFILTLLCCDNGNIPYRPVVNQSRLVFIEACYWTIDISSS